MGGGALHGAAVGPPIVEVVALGVEMAQGGATPHAALLEGKGGFGLRSAKIAVARVGFEKGGLTNGATEQVYHAGHSVGAVEHGAGSAHNFDAPGVEEA